MKLYLLFIFFIIIIPLKGEITQWRIGDASFGGILSSREEILPVNDTRISSFIYVSLCEMLIKKQRISYYLNWNKNIQE